MHSFRKCVTRDARKSIYTIRPETFADLAYTIMLIVYSASDLLALYLLVQEVKTVIKDVYCVKRSLMMAKLVSHKWKTTRGRAATFLSQCKLSISILEGTRSSITTMNEINNFGFSKILVISRLKRNSINWHLLRACPSLKGTSKRGSTRDSQIRSLRGLFSW